MDNTADRRAFLKHLESLASSDGFAFDFAPDMCFHAHNKKENVLEAVVQPASLDANLVL